MSFLLPAPFLFFQRRFLSLFLLASGKDPIIQNVCVYVCLHRSAIQFHGLLNFLKCVHRIY
jgi:hypothetical protein